MYCKNKHTIYFLREVNRKTFFPVNSSPSYKRIFPQWLWCLANEPAFLQHLLAAAPLCHQVQWRNRIVIENVLAPNAVAFKLISTGF